MTSIQTYTLSCGMPLLVEPVAGVASAGVTWLLPAGSAHDPEAFEGISGMWAELLFRGAGDRDSRGQADAMDLVGMARSTSSGTRFMKVGTTVLGTRFADAMPILVDMVRRPRFEQASIDPARELALASLAALADDPHERAVLRARLLHNPIPLNRSGLGTEAGLRAITRESVVDGWNERARPEGSILAVAGAVEPDAVRDQCEELLSDWRGRAPELQVRENPRCGSTEHMEEQSSQMQIVVVHDAPPEPHPHSALERVVNSVLSGGMASRLFTEVREKRGLCYSVSAVYSADKDRGRVTAYVGTTPERAGESLQVLRAELDRINGPASSGGGVTKDEVDRALVGIRSRIVFSGESTGARAAAIAGDLHRLGRARSLEEVMAKYAGITADSVNDYLATRQLGKVTTVTLGQKQGS